jgi:methyl-galactoside transport system permease protein
MNLIEKIGEFFKRIPTGIKNYFKSIKEMTLTDWKNMFLNNAIYIFMLGLLVILISFEPDLLGLRPLGSILEQSATKLFFAMAVGMIIITQGTDLSVGRIVGLVAVISGSLLQTTGVFFPGSTGISFMLVIPIAMVIGSLCSVLNAIFISKLRIDPFIATLGSSLVFFGFIQWYYLSPETAQPIGNFSAAFQSFVNAPFLIMGDLVIKNVVVYSIVGIVFSYIVWYKTRLGRNMYAIGGNKEAAVVSGINYTATLVIVFAIAGALYGLGAVLEVGRVGSVTTAFGFGYELDAIAACIVGGISFNGGIGKLRGVVAGVLLFTVISYGMTFVGWEPQFQNILKGLIIVMAVAIDSRKYRKHK